MRVASHLDAEVADVVLHEPDGGDELRVARRDSIRGCRPRSPAIVSREASSSWNSASAHFATSPHDPNSRHLHDLARLVPVGRGVLDIDRGDVAAFPDVHGVAGASAPACGQCSGRPFGQSRRWRMQARRNAGAEIVLVGVASAEERVRAFERPGVVDDVAGTHVA